MLDADIEAINLAKETSSITPTQVASSSVRDLLTVIGVGSFGSHRSIAD